RRAGHLPRPSRVRARVPTGNVEENSWRADRHSNPRWLFDACIAESVTDDLMLSMVVHFTDRKTPILWPYSRSSLNRFPRCLPDRQEISSLHTLEKSSQEARLPT